MDTVNQLANELKLKVLSHLNYKPKLKTGTFNQLSNELKLLVFSHLDFVSKLECVFVCKSWGELIFSNCLFEDICINPKTLQFFKTQMEYNCQVKYLTFFGFTDDSYPILLELPDIFPNVRSFKVRLGEQFDLGLPKIRKTRRVSYYDIDFLFADDQEDDDQEDDYQEVRYREVEYEGVDEEAIIKKYQEQFTKWKQLDTIYEDQYRDTPLISCVLLQQPTNHLVSITLCGGETYYDYWDNYCLESSEFITKLKKMLSTDLRFATSLQHLRIMGNVVTLQMLEEIHKAVPHLKRLELHDFIPDVDDLDVESPYERPGEICDTLELFDCKVYFKEYYRENRLADELINPVWLSYIADKYINLESFEFSCDMEERLGGEPYWDFRTHLYRPYGEDIRKSNPQIKKFKLMSWKTPIVENNFLKDEISRKKNGTLDQPQKGPRRGVCLLLAILIFLHSLLLEVWHTLFPHTKTWREYA